MNVPRQSKPNTGQLPKSVKVRSTCNACQQAKIRCSHEKPSCRRCQKHKIECIYSVSRRLGRPAKKKESRHRQDEQSHNPVLERADQPEIEKKIRKSTKKKNSSSQNGTDARARNGRCLDRKIIQERLSASARTESGGEEAPEEIEIDFDSENWLQELVPTRISVDTAPELHYGEIGFEDSFDSSSEGLSHHGLPAPFQASDIYVSTFQGGPILASTYMSIERELGPFQPLVPEKQLDTPSMSENFPMFWSYEPNTRIETHSFPENWPMDKVSPTDSSVDPMEGCIGLKSPGDSHDSDIYSPENAGFMPTLEGIPTFTCSCFKQSLGDLVRMGLKTGPNGLSSIDRIIAWQKELLLQAESILQCKICSQSELQANMLMVIIVIIDSLLTTLDVTATSTKGPVQDGMPVMSIQNGGKISKNMGAGFKSHIDACPLLVGGFPVPSEEKTCFVRQILQTRLSMLLLTVRRIRACMEQDLAAAISRGRMLMIMETDRRLQLIMMKIKMAVG